METITKVCGKCGQEKPLDHFAKNEKYKGGHVNRCRACATQQMRESRERRRLIAKTIPETKVCPRCQIEKPASAYRKDTANHDGLQFWCASCYREYNDSNREELNEKAYFRSIKSQFGLSREDYEAMLIAQDGKCALCGGDSNGKGRLHVDHCHSEGHVRGLLCWTCNGHLGWLERIGLSKIESYVA